MMMTWKQFLIEKGGDYDFSSTQYNLPKDISKEIIKWGEENIPEEDVYVVAGDNTFGREDQIHVTVLYGIHDTEPDKVKKILEEVDPFDIVLDKVSLFTNNFKYDVVKIDVKSKSLHKANELLMNKVAHSNRYKSYVPHVTVSYVKKGSGKKLSGDKTFAGEKINVDNIVFSSSNGKKTPIKLA